jgi:hypothetical protein
VRPNGTFDPGAVDPATGQLEYDGNRDLAGRVAEALRVAGHEVTSEADDVYQQDSDYEGSVDAVNAGGYDLAVDFHQDWSGGSQALCWPLVHPGGGQSHLVADAMVAACRAAGLSTAGPTNRSDLWWLNGTNCPAVLVEAGRVGTARPVEQLAAAIAGAIDSTLDGDPIPEGGFPPAQNPGAPPGDATIPPAGQYPAWPGVYLINFLEEPSVSTWQAQMSKRGWSLVVDGAYGDQSAAVCVGFQNEKGLYSDGVVGPDTWAAAWTAPIT